MTSAKSNWKFEVNSKYFQIEEFRRLRTYHKGEQPVKGEDGCLADNFRPTQPINDRVIKASFQWNNLIGNKKIILGSWELKSAKLNIAVTLVYC